MKSCRGKVVQLRKKKMMEKAMRSLLKKNWQRKRSLQMSIDTLNKRIALNIN
jgi:hypothetical protein